MEEFRKLGLSPESVKVLEKKGYTSPTPIQAKVLPMLLHGKKDIVGQSQTGTGKTAVFALPIIEKIEAGNKQVQAIVLTPTRELALQVAKEFDSLKGDKKIKVLAVYGGAAIGPQRQHLKYGVDIVVGTPGRVMDLQRRKSLKLDFIRYAVLDEADEMLNMGFVDDIETILQNTPKDKRMLLFSATMPKPILRIAQKYMGDYELIETKAQEITDTVEQIYYDISPKDRLDALRRVLDYYSDFYGIVFCATKATVDSLARQLKKMQYSAAALHGDITQSQREEILGQFRIKNVKILVATDVAARGIDVDDLTHVINYSLPQSPESYVHRIGRTGRAGKKGISITFVTPSERGGLNYMERINKCRLKKQPLPSPKQIIETREAEIIAIINRIADANKGKQTKYLEMARELLKGREPDELVAAVMKYHFKNVLDTTYKNIVEPQYVKHKPKKREFHKPKSGKKWYQRKRK